MSDSGGPTIGPDFDGEVYESDLDRERLTGQLLKVYEVMRDHEWRTIAEIQALTGIRLDGSISKQLRHLRYERFGAYLVEKRRRGPAGVGVWEYRVGERGAHVPPPTPARGWQVNFQNPGPSGYAEVEVFRDGRHVFSGVDRTALMDGKTKIQPELFDSMAKVIPESDVVHLPGRAPVQLDLSRPR
jgi:hypothetical protein